MNDYELIIDCTDQNNYESLILEKIKPLIEELESSNLIKGFYFIRHETLDLRLKKVSEDDIGQIKNVISANSLSNYIFKEAKPIDQNSDQYKDFGPEGMEILSQSLEHFSRLIIQIFEYKEKIKERNPDKLEQTIERLNHQIVHHFLIQQGMDILQQIYFSLDDAKTWASYLSRQEEIYPERTLTALKKIKQFNPLA